MPARFAPSTFSFTPPIGRTTPESVISPVIASRFFTGRFVQFVTLAAHNRVPAAYTQRDFVEAGGLMSYGTDIPDMLRQVGVYTGQILKGVKPADLPVAQSTKFEFLINLQTARALGLDVPNSIQWLADQLIE